MTAFKPISPAAAVALLDGIDVDPMVFLADLADAGIVKAYARLLELQDNEGRREIRDSRLPRDLWRRIIESDNIESVFVTGTVRMPDSSNGAEPKVVAIGIRFDDRSIREARDQHCKDIAPAVGDSTARAVAPPALPALEEVTAPQPSPAQAKSALPVSIPDGAVQLSIDRTASVLGVGRTTIYKMIADGQLVLNKTRGRSFVSVESIRSHIAV